MDGKREGKMFRFQELEIWKKAIDIGNKLLDIADELEKRRLYRFAEQVRGAASRFRITLQREAVRI